MATDNPESAPGNAAPGSGTRPDPQGATEPTAEHGPQLAAGPHQPATGNYQPGQYQPAAGYGPPGYPQDYGPPAFGPQTSGQPGYVQPGYGGGPPTAVPRVSADGVRPAVDSCARPKSRGVPPTRAPRELC
jgi:hypothetical protein